MEYSFVLTIPSANNKIKDIFRNNTLFFRKIQMFMSMKLFLEEHNQFCLAIYQYNRFFSEMYLLLLVTMIPLNMLGLHQLLFEDLDLSLGSYLAFLMAVLFVMFIGLSYTATFISRRAHSMAVPLSQLQWRLHGWPFRLNNKIKLMTYFERLSDKKKIGFTIGPLITVTSPIFAKV